VLACDLQLYHPSSAPQDTYSYIDSNGTFNMRTAHMRPYIGDDGALHLVADRETIQEQLLSLELERARMLTQVGTDSPPCWRQGLMSAAVPRPPTRPRFLAQVSFFWLKRVRDLTPAVTQLLGVRSVWCDTKTEQNSQKFVIWAGFLLEKR
jgi:hypothetical protein